MVESWSDSKSDSLWEVRILSAADCLRQSFRSIFFCQYWFIERKSNRHTFFTTCYCIYGCAKILLVKFRLDLIQRNIGIIWKQVKDRLIFLQWRNANYFFTHFVANASNFPWYGYRDRRSFAMWLISNWLFFGKIKLKLLKAIVLRWILRQKIHA